MLNNIIRKIKKILFTRNEQRIFLEDVSTLVKDGVPAPQAIATVHEIAKGITKDVTKSILDGIAQGQRISESMSFWFNPVIVEMIRAGEEGGALVETMVAAAGSLAQRESAVNSFLSSVLYPVTVFFMALGVAIFLKHSVLESFATVKPVAGWPDNGKLLMEFATFIEHWWWLLLIIIVSSSFFIKEILVNSTGKFRHTIDELPLLSLYKDFTSANFMEVLGLLLTNGVSFKQALSIVQKNSGRYLSWHIQMMQLRLSSGKENIAEVLDTGMVKSDDIFRLKVMAKGKGFDHALLSLGAQALVRSSNSVKLTGRIMGGILLAFDAGLAIFMIFAVYGVGTFIGT